MWDATRGRSMISVSSYVLDPVLVCSLRNFEEGRLVYFRGYSAATRCRCRAPYPLQALMK